MATNPRYWTTVLWAGFAAGVGDTLLAIALFHVGPVRIYQSVAAGLLGRESFQGGLASAALGMFLHFFIATTAAPSTSRRARGSSCCSLSPSPLGWRSAPPSTSS
jgi:hypothetical protein